MQWWQPLLPGAPIALAVLGLVVWLVRQLVTSAQKNADKLIAAADVKATEMIAAANKAADDRVKDSDARADEWKETAGVFQSALQQQRDIAQRAIEANKITDHFFETYMPPVRKTGDNKAVEG